MRHVIFALAIGSILIGCAYGQSASSDSSGRRSRVAVSVVGTLAFPTQANYSGRALAPVWSAGSLLSAENDIQPYPIVHVYGRDGKEQKGFAINIPGADYATVLSVSRNINGEIAVCGGAFKDDGRASGYIAVNSAPGKQTIIRTEEYEPSRLVVDDQGNVWTAGKTFGASAGNAFVFHEFAPSGEEIGKFVSQSSFPSPVVIPESFMTFSNGSIAWFCPRAERYIEIDATGSVTDVSPVRPEMSTERVTGLARIADGRVFISTSDVSPTQAAIYAIDKHDGHVTAAIRGRLTLLGSDDSYLVARALSGNRLVFFSVNQR